MTIVSTCSRMIASILRPTFWHQAWPTLFAMLGSMGQCRNFVRLNPERFLRIGNVVTFPTRYCASANSDGKGLCQTVLHLGTVSRASLRTQASNRLGRGSSSRYDSPLSAHSQPSFTRPSMDTVARIRICDSDHYVTLVLATFVLLCSCCTVGSVCTAGYSND